MTVTKEIGAVARFDAQKKCPGNLNVARAGNTRFGVPGTGCFRPEGEE